MAAALTTYLQQNHNLAQSDALRLTPPGLAGSIFDRLVDVFPHVVDVRKFLKSFDLMRVNPYEKKEFGEKPEFAYRVRERFAEVLVESLSASLEQSKRPPGPGEAQDTTEVSSRLEKELGALEERTTDVNRLGFAAWTLWQRHATRLYMPVNMLFAYCYKWRIDTKAFMKVLHRHSTQTTMYTTRDLHECERIVGTFLHTATELGLSARNNPGLDAVQNAAIGTALGSSFSALQGSAGCGKTTTVAHLVNEVASQCDIICLAFTHKAKRCIRSKLDNNTVQVSTIHSFVKANKAGSELDRLFILLDETSMVDLELMADLARTVVACCKSGYQLSFVGDEGQLPPIGRGEFFRQLVGTRGANVSTLQKCYRVDRPDMFAAYQSVREGVLPRGTPNFEVHIVPDDDAVGATVGRIIRGSDVERTQFIAWMNRDVKIINDWVQDKLFREGKLGPAKWLTFFLHDRVIYRGENKGALTNAMIGCVVEIKSELGHPRGMTVEWEDRSRTTFSKMARDVFLAYCITAHSSQGSEYERVVVACFDVAKMARSLDRRFFYTAITRAKNHVVVVGTEDLKAYVAREIAAPPVTELSICDGTGPPCRGGASPLFD
jgi:hypothetical protein